MSDKVKKSASGLSFSFSRWFSKVSTMKPSSLLITVVLVGIAVFLLGGGLYDLINQPLPAVYYNSRFYFLYPSLSDQFLFDTVVAVILYMLGFVGLLTLYQSSKHAYSPRQAYMTMIIGATLILLAYILLEYVIHLKIIGG